MAINVLGRLVLWIIGVIHELRRRKGVPKKSTWKTTMMVWIIEVDMLHILSIAPLKMKHCDTYPSIFMYTEPLHFAVLCLVLSFNCRNQACVICTCQLQSTSGYDISICGDKNQNIFSNLEHSYCLTSLKGDLPELWRQFYCWLHSWFIDYMKNSFVHPKNSPSLLTIQIRNCSVLCSKLLLYPKCKRWFYLYCSTSTCTFLSSAKLKSRPGSRAICFITYRISKGARH